MTAITDALQATLAGEHAAVYGFGVVGARLPHREQGAARKALAEHRRRRDALRVALRRRGVVPVAAEPAYTFPFAVRDPNDARQLAARLEDRLIPLWVRLLGRYDDPGARRLAVAFAQQSAVVAVAWRDRAGDHSPGRAFPGR